MRTPESTIKAAILHPEEEVRLAALAYFARSHTTDPSIMPLVIEAVQKYGRRGAFNLLRSAAALPQTKATTRWLLDQLHGGLDWEKVEDDNYGFALALVLCDADLEQLAEPVETIVNSPEFPEELEDWLAERWEMRAWDWDQAWSELEKFGRAVRERGRFRINDVRRGGRILEALARHPEKGDVVLPLLHRRYKGYEKDLMEWLEWPLIELAGRMRLEEAIPILVERLLEDDVQICASCVTALQWIGGDRLVQAISEQWPDAAADFCQSAAEVLEHVHTDLCAEKCLEFFAAEDDEEPKSYLAYALLGNFVPEAVEPIRQMVLEDDAAYGEAEFKVPLIAAATVMGVSFPEYAAWRQEIATSEQEEQQSAEPPRIRETFLEDEDEWEDEWDDETDEYLDEEEDDDLDLEEDAGFDLSEFQPPGETIRNEREPVGRNDPCPCGSGKKYKKCCLKKDQEQANQPKFPIGTVALYGPDDKQTTKIVASVIQWPGADPILERWVGTKVKSDFKVRRQILEFFQRHRVRSVVATESNMGCPHEEGIDFPEGGDCPFCPFWKGKQGSGAKE